MAGASCIRCAADAGHGGGRNGTADLAGGRASQACLVCFALGYTPHRRGATSLPRLAGRGARPPDATPIPGPRLGSRAGPALNAPPDADACGRHGRRRSQDQAGVAGRECPAAPVTHRAKASGQASRTPGNRLRLVLLVPRYRRVLLTRQLIAVEGSVSIHQTGVNRSASSSSRGLHGPAGGMRLPVAERRSLRSAELNSITRTALGIVSADVRRTRRVWRLFDVPTLTQQALEDAPQIGFALDANAGGVAERDGPIDHGGVVG